MKRILIVASLLLLGCESQNQDEKSRATQPAQDSAVTLFKRQIEAEGSAVFISRGGTFFGMDSDASLSFEADGHLELLECGIQPVTYRGSYTIDPSGLVRADLPTYRAKWPDMISSIRDQQILLGRADGRQDLEMGGRAVATELGDMPPFWPFNMIYHASRKCWGSVSGLTEGWIGDGKRVVFVPSASGGEWNASMAQLEFLSASTLSYSPSGSAGPTFNGKYGVDDSGTIRIELTGDVERLPEVVWFCEGDDSSKFFLGSRRDLHQQKFGDDSSSQFIGGMPWRMVQPASDPK